MLRAFWGRKVSWHGLMNTESEPDRHQRSPLGHNTTPPGTPLLCQTPKKLLKMLQKMLQDFNCEDRCFLKYIPGGPWWLTRNRWHGSGAPRNRHKSRWVETFQPKKKMQIWRRTCKTPFRCHFDPIFSSSFNPAPTYFSGPGGRPQPGWEKNLAGWFVMQSIRIKGLP